MFESAFGDGPKKERESEMAAGEAQRAKRAEVARMAGVSETTVSFVFSRKRYVSPQLVERVERAARLLDYQPDAIAASMKMGITNTIAVLTNDLTNPLQMKIIKSIEEAAMAEGFFVNICGGSKNLDRYIANLISRRIDGVFLAGDPFAITGGYMNKLLGKQISVILGTVNNISDPRLCGIGVDFEECMVSILRYLRELGHEKIAYLSAFDDRERGDLRLSAFHRFMKEYFGNPDPVVETGRPPYESTVRSGHGLTNALLERTRDFTALVCTNDMMAFGAISALQQAGLRVPEDVSVVGIDDLVFAKDFFPPLTTLSHETEQFGRRVFEILYDNIRDKSVVQRELIAPKLIVRSSTAPPRPR